MRDFDLLRAACRGSEVGEQLRILTTVPRAHLLGGKMGKRLISPYPGGPHKITPRRAARLVLLIMGHPDLVWVKFDHFSIKA